MSAHYRNLSPSRGRHSMIDPMRASTGTVQLNSSYDSYDAPRRYDHDEYPSDAGYTSAYAYRSGRPSKLEAHQISSHRVRDPSTSTKKRTEYTVQPRTRNRSNTSTAADYETPVRLAVPSTPRQHLSPVHQHHSTHRRTPSPLPTDSGHHIVSASPRHPAHRRIYSTDYASDTSYIDSRNDVRHRTDRSPHQHRVHPPTRAPRYPAYDGLRKGDDIDNFDAYSYTNAREQFDRDYPVKARHHGPRYSLDRPLSITGVEDSSQWMPRKERHHGPPPTSWGLDKLGRERPRSSTHGMDDHRESYRSKDGFHDQALVTVPQDSDAEYSSRHDERRRRRAYRARHANDREHHYPEGHHPKPHEMGALATVGLGTAALGGGYSDMSDYEHHRPSRSKQRRPHSEHDHDAVQPPSRDLVEAVPASERNKQTYLDPADARRHGRPRRHSRRRTHSDDANTSDEDLRNYRREPARHRHSSTDTESDRDRDRSRDRSRHRRDRDHSRGYHSSRSRHMLEDGHSTERRSPPVDMAKDDPKRLIAVDPAAPKEPDAPPKGILKAPRQAFPEEPNPVREGVAPLKDAHKQGIPPGARWTKIDRRLVNPEALEAGNERFEERSDYVIVLRVLSKEEIQKYAVKTQEIRDTRHKEQLRERRKTRDETHRHGRRGEETSSDDEDEGEEEPWKQLEAAPAPPAQKMSLPSRPRASTNSMHEAERPRISNPSAAPA
ncbi:uncharacterized protein N7479_005620 [Penicillium vulpinum]|uniref:DUF8035 domain-containing protein n=1 Tax=Penicillium vulpinum TaxID=29845 RepID=A0A1V6SFY0_9EURO|nr:uncharacterized protein N7479_005620 [Penicillium vulpinum]KAJ5958470.1 hypothetical protein N7479_005620 [Penicillium vulpinum]OQE12473.1 hypothetical protein PENVUL_c001G08698 [Penicillium vulpinum]